MSRVPGIAAALALGVLLTACTAGDEAAPGPTAPVAAATDGAVATVRAEPRDIYRTIRLEGTVEPYDAVPVTAAESGEFVPARGGKRARTVAKGERLGTITCPPEQPAGSEATGEQGKSTTPAPAASPSATPSAQPSPTPACRVTVRAPAAGRMPALRESDVSAGDAITSIQPPGLRIRLPVTDPVTLYAFKQPPKSGKAEIVGGPSGFSVKFERRQYDKDSGQTTVFVRMPGDVEAFAGLKAIVVFVTNVQDGLLTLPLSAVRGRSGTGQVVTVDAQGKRTVVEVELGASDDAYVAVEGVDENADVLLYPLESDFGG